MGKKVRERIFAEATLKDMLDRNRKYDVTPITLIGRGDDAHIRIESKRVSRLHAKIVLEGQEYVLEDMSKNGTLVNGTVVKNTRCRLSDGDTIEIQKTNPETKQSEPVFKAKLRVELRTVKERSGLLDSFLGLFGK